MIHLLAFGRNISGAYQDLQKQYIFGEKGIS